jgi:hypothetical protein
MRGVAGMGWGASVLESSSDKESKGQQNEIFKWKNVVYCTAQILNH